MRGQFGCAIKPDVRVGIIFFLISVSAFSFETGFNIAWWKNNYSRQWLNGVFDAKEMSRQLQLAHQGRAARVRLWLFEGQSLANFELDGNGLPTAIKPEVLSNLKTTLAEAERLKLHVNLTLLDANAFCQNRQPTGAELTARYFWYNVINRKFGAREQFNRNILIPLVSFLKQFPHVDQLELANEINALISCEMAAETWYTLSDLQCSFREQVKKVSDVMTTSSVGWGGAEQVILSNSLYADCVDYYDLHVYHDGGVIPRCEEFVALAASKKLQLGEFGQLSEQTDDELQVNVTRNFLANAPRCGFTSAMAWRLDDPQIDKSPFGRFSFVRNGRLRPAFFEMKK